MRDILTTAAFIASAILIAAAPGLVNAMPDPLADDRPTLAPLNIQLPCSKSINDLTRVVSMTTGDKYRFTLLSGDFDQWARDHDFQIKLPGITEEGLIMLREHKHGHSMVVAKLTSWMTGDTSFCAFGVFRSRKKGEPRTDTIIGRGT